MTLESDFDQAVTQHLALLQSEVDAALLRLVDALSFDVRCLILEYDSPSFAAHFAVTAVVVRKDGTVGPTQRLLEGNAVVVPASIYDADRFEELDPWDRASDLLERWMIERWAGLPRRLPTAFIAHHDSHWRTDLADGRRLSADDVDARCVNTPP